MAHNIQDMMYVGNTPWHGLGKALEIPPSTENALKLSGLDWTVHKDQTYLGDTPTGYYCTYRYDSDMSKVILGNVSKRYEILQNEEAFQPFDEALLEFGYTYETAGSLGDGEKIWILAKSPEYKLVGDDKIDQYVLLFNSHDGSSGVVMRPTLIRVVCQNTLDFSLNQKGQQIKFKHTANVRERLDNFTQLLINTQGDMNTAIFEMNQFQEYEMKLKDVQWYFEKIFPALVHRHEENYDPITGRKKPNFAMPMYAALVQNFYEGKGNHGKNLFDAYNAVTEFIDHNKNYQDPLKSIGFGWGYKQKQKAFSLASELVTS